MGFSLNICKIMFMGECFSEKIRGASRRGQRASRESRVLDGATLFILAICGWSDW